ncbi:Rrn3p [Sugiyamaella lignohabitans]|uniref:Rrn3p n=1 Tax=Sugiyamaella lignohabitans TaxID=796027 RepID=A0A161HIJ2_9ASCO|nr:Rrn3p [Sugiyamaella lignohabitans]ANB12327.1 Rrn3p [Sugiyamaella lignohabitans]
MPAVVPSMTVIDSNSNRTPTPPLSRASSPSIKTIKSALKKSSSIGSDGSLMSSNNLNFSETVYKARVQDALDQLTFHKNANPINHLVAQLEIPSNSSESLTPEKSLYLVKALTSEVSRLDSPSCAPLINAILKMKWTNKNADFVSAYVRFLGVLVSSIPKWWTEVANKVISEFTMKETTAHHSVLSYILKIIPTASSTVSGIFIKNFPHKSDTSKHLVCYVKNLLKTVEYCDELERSVWALIFERTVQLDVELYEELEDEDDDIDDDDDEYDDDDDVDLDQDKDENGTSYTSELAVKLEEESSDDEDDGDDWDDNASDMSEYDVEDHITTDVKSLKRKLDSIITLLFDYLDTKFNAEKLNSPQTVQLFTTLVDLFKAFILSTHRTRSVQYIIFRTCHAHPDLLDAFLVSMIELALSPSENVERRQKAMQYISSFIARAKGLSRAQIIFVVSFLTGWLDRYIREREIEVDNAVGGMGRFKMFYSVSQALFYIFCFRHSILRKTDDVESSSVATPAPSTKRAVSPSSEWECDLDHLFQRVILTKFNPLRYCKHTVVAMFAQIAQKENAAYCFTIIEQNRLGGFRSSSSISSGNISDSGALPSPLSNYSSNSYFGAGNTFWTKSQEFVALEGYFPFDPLMLPKARHYLDGLYVEWEEVAEDFSDGSSDEDDEAENDTDSDESDSDIDMSNDDEDSD